MKRPIFRLLPGSLPEDDPLASCAEVCAYPLQLFRVVVPNRPADPGADDASRCERASSTPWQITSDFDTPETLSTRSTNSVGSRKILFAP
jgi:hypothetical protein